MRGLMNAWYFRPIVSTRWSVMWRRSASSSPKSWWFRTNPVKTNVKSSAVSWMAVSSCCLLVETMSDLPSFFAIASSTRTDWERSRLFSATLLIRFQTGRESQPRGARLARACSTTERGVTMPRCTSMSRVISRRCPESRQNSKLQRTTALAKLWASSSSEGRSFANTCWWPSSILFMCVGVFAPCCSTDTVKSSTTDSNDHGSLGLSPKSSSSLAAPPALAGGACLSAGGACWSAASVLATSRPPLCSSSCLSSSFTRRTSPSPSFLFLLLSDWSSSVVPVVPVAAAAGASDAPLAVFSAALHGVAASPSISSPPSSRRHFVGGSLASSPDLWLHSASSCLL
mmetsp:Transcript_97098/g.275059  ORF Transcript_97098/g.275059 Transcript_97098/m.275059 type:complete len:343 (-) Transcript_97098:1745-2773(-)